MGCAASCRFRYTMLQSLPISRCCLPCRELSRRVEQFVLRRTREVNARYLPPLSSYVVFCR